MNQIVAQQEEIKDINNNFRNGHMYLGDKGAYDRDIKQALSDLREMKKELIRFQDSRGIKHE